MRDFGHNRLSYHLITCIHLARECNSYLRALRRKEIPLFFFKLGEDRFFHGVNVPRCSSSDVDRSPVSRSLEN